MSGTTNETASGTIPTGDQKPSPAAIKQQSYRIDCPECHGTGRVKRYIGHPGRVASFVCFACVGNDREESEGAS